MFVPDAGSIESRRNGQRFSLPRGDSLLKYDDEPGRNSESDLGEHKPEPVDTLVHYRVDERENAIDHAGPQQWRHEAAQHYRTARQHGQHRSVEKSNQERDQEVNGNSDQELTENENPDLSARVPHHLGKQSR